MIFQGISQSHHITEFRLESQLCAWYPIGYSGYPSESDKCSDNKFSFGYSDVDRMNFSCPIGTLVSIRDFMSKIRAFIYFNIQLNIWWFSFDIHIPWIKNRFFIIIPWIIIRASVYTVFIWSTLIDYDFGIVVIDTFSPISRTLLGLWKIDVFRKLVK